MIRVVLPVLAAAMLLGACQAPGGRPAPPPIPIHRPGMVERFSPRYALRVYEKHPGGQDMNFALTELERRARTSTVLYKYRSGATVGSSMTGMLALARIGQLRGAKYFTVLQEWITPAEDSVFLVGYASRKVHDRRRFFGVQGPLKPADDAPTYIAIADLLDLFRLPHGSPAGKSACRPGSPG